MNQTTILQTSCKLHNYKFIEGELHVDLICDWLKLKQKKCWLVVFVTILYNEVRTRWNRWPCWTHRGCFRNREDTWRHWDINTARSYLTGWNRRLALATWVDTQLKCLITAHAKHNPPHSVVFFCSCDKVYHKLEVSFLYLLGQILTWQYNYYLLDKNWPCTDKWTWLAVGELFIVVYKKNLLQ